MAAGVEVSAHGNVDHEFEIQPDSTRVAEVSTKWFRVRDTNGVDVAPEQNDALIPAVRVCIDQLARG